MQVERIEVSRLTGDPANARKHGERNIRTIVESLSRFGQQKPIVVDSSFCVRAGNGTLEAARSLGWTHLDCVVTDLKGSDAIAYAIADNRTAELAEWDSGVLAATLEGLQLDDEALLTAAGFSEDELKELLADIELTGDGATGEIVEDEVPEPPVDPITKPGDLWLLGRHRVLCGDSTKAEDVGRLMAGAKADLCFTSPPYCVGTSGWSDGEKYNHGDDSDLDSWRSLLDNSVSLAITNASVVFVNLQMVSRNRAVLIDWLHSLKNNVVDIAIWDKSHGAPAMQPGVFSGAFEFIFIFAGDHPTRMIPGASWRGTHSNVARVNREHNAFAEIHRAIYPVALPAWGFEIVDAANSVYEPFCGTGTTLIAAEQLNRTCYGMEISPQYCDVIVNRWEKLTGKKAVLDGNTGHANDGESTTAAVADQTGVSGRDNKATNSNRRKPKKQPA